MAVPAEAPRLATNSPALPPGCRKRCGCGCGRWRTPWLRHGRTASPLSACSAASPNRWKTSAPGTGCPRSSEWTPAQRCAEPTGSASIPGPGRAARPAHRRSCRAEHAARHVRGQHHQPGYVPFGRGLHGARGRRLPRPPGRRRRGPRRRRDVLHAQVRDDVHRRRALPVHEVRTGDVSRSGRVPPPRSPWPRRPAATRAERTTTRSISPCGQMIISLSGARPCWNSPRPSTAGPPRSWRCDACASPTAHSAGPGCLQALTPSFPRARYLAEDC